MNDQDKSRCWEFSQLLLGKFAKKTEIDSVIKNVMTFEEFRIAFVLKFEGSIPAVKRVSSKWREKIFEKKTLSDSNDLMHTAELLVIKQTALEQELHENTVEMLDKLKAIDSLVILQANMRERLAEVSDLIAQFRKHSARVESIQTLKGPAKS